MTDRLYSHVLVPTDFGPGCRAAYRVALAAARGSGAAVSLLHVIPGPTGDDYHGLDAIRLLHRAAERVGSDGLLPAGELSAAEARCLDRLRAEIPAAAAGPTELRLEVRRGDVTAEVARYAAETDVDLIVAGGARPGLIPDLGFGLADRVARATPVEVVRVTPPQPA